MRYFIISFFVAILSIFRLPVKAAKKTATKFGQTAIILKNRTDSLTQHVDTLAREFVDYAKALIGTPYAWGSVNPNGRSRLFRPCQFRFTPFWDNSAEDICAVHRTWDRDKTRRSNARGSNSLYWTKRKTESGWTYGNCY